MNLLDYIVAYKEIVIIFILLLVIICILLFTKPKKIKPIEKTIDDTLNEKTEIEKVIEALETSKESRTMTSFEEEQEANAIISYQELVQAVKEKKALMEVPEPEKQIDREENSIVDTTLNNQLSNTTTEAVEPVKEKQKFKSSEFISPIFGKAKNNDDFLKELKDFRSNL